MGVLRSRNGGKSWQPIGLAGESVYRLSYLERLGRVVAMTDRGAFYSADNGATWKRTGSGVSASMVRALGAATDGRALVAGLDRCPGGIARSSDDGKTWQIAEIREPGLYYGLGVDTIVEAVAFAPSRPRRVYAGTIDAVLRSDNSGAAWTRSRFPDYVSGGHVVALAVHPTDPDLVFAGGAHGLMRSRDGARTWTAAGAGADLTAVVFDPGRPSRMLAASWFGGLARSSDTGASWSFIPGTDFLRASALAIDPRDGELVLASSMWDDTIYRSVDGGANWAQSNAGIEGIVRSLAFAADGSEVVAAGDGGVFRSVDRGKTWQRVPEGPSNARAVVLQLGGVVHAGTDVGVFSSPQVSP